MADPARDGGGSRRTGYRWTLVLLLVYLGVLALGYLGLREYHELHGERRTLFDQLYGALQLFALNLGPVERPVPWTLELARFLAPIVTASAFIGAFVAVFRAQATEKRVQWFARDHVLICGLGIIGRTLAKRFRRAGYRVVAIEADPTNPSIAECRAEGVVVLTGNATDQALLGKAIRRARFMFAVAGDDGANLQIAVLARELVARRGRAPLTCFVHMLDAELASLLIQAEIEAPRGDLLRLEYFNTQELGAPAMLAMQSPLFDRDDVAGGSPQLVVVGCGEMGSRVILHAARRWSNANGEAGRPLRISVVDMAASRATQSLLERFPGLDRTCEIAPWQMRVEDPAFDTAEFLADPKTVFICLPDDAGGLSAALRLRRRLPVETPIIVRATQHGGLEGILSLTESDSYKNVRVFPLMDEVCEPDALLRGKNEVLARALHERYLQQQVGAGKQPGSSPGLVEWDGLAERYRESNRREADDIGRKLEAVRCSLEPLSLGDRRHLDFSPEEIELMAAMEHERWRQELGSHGWSHGPRRDEQMKTHPALVPWDRLPEGEKQKNRETVRSLPALLADVGFRIVRR